MKKTVFLDTNVLIDYLDKRDDYRAVSDILMAHAIGQLRLIATTLTMVNITYIRRKTVTIEQAYDEFDKLSRFVDIVNMSDIAYRKALVARWKDFEDALQYFSAVEAGAVCIVTRNAKDFAASHLPIMTPTEFLCTNIV